MISIGPKIRQQQWAMFCFFEFFDIGLVFFGGFHYSEMVNCSINDLVFSCNFKSISVIHEGYKSPTFDRKVPKMSKISLESIPEP